MVLRDQTAVAKTIRVPTSFADLRNTVNKAAVGLAFNTLKRAGVLPYWQQTLYRTMTGSDQSREARSLAYYYGSDPWFPAVVTIPAELIASWPARLHRRRRNGELRRVDDLHPANDIINRRPDRREGPEAQTALQFQCEALSWFIMLGTFYIRKGPKGMVRPVELTVLNPLHMHPIAKSRKVVGYRYQRPEGGVEEIDIDELIIGRRFNPNSDIVGQGVGQPLLDTLEGRRLAAKWTRNLMENDGASSDLYATSKEPKTEEQARRAAEEFATKYGGADADEAGKLMFMGDWEIKDIGRSPRDMQWQEFTSNSRVDLGAGGRVDSRLMGNPTSSTYNNLIEARKGLVDFNGLPIATQFWDVINTRFVKPVYGEDLEFVLDLSREPVAMERNGEMIDRLEKLAAPGAGKAQIISVGEMRDALAELLPTVAAAFRENEPADYVRTIPMGAVPNTYNLSRSTPAEPSPPSGDAGEEPEGTEGEDSTERTTPRESSARGFGLLFGAGRPPSKRVESGYIEGVFYWGEEFRKKAIEIAETYHRELFGSRLGEVADELGIELEDAFLDTDPRTVKYLRQYPVTSANYWTETTIQMLRTELEASVAEGETISQALERVDAVFNFRKNNAIVVAITQTTPSYNGAAVAAYAKGAEEGVIEGKEWLPNTERHANVPADNGVVPADGYFSVNGSLGRYPGDPSLPIGEIAGCACSVMPALTPENERTVKPEEVRARTHEAIQAWAGRYEPGLRELLSTAQKQMRTALEALEAGEEADDRGADHGTGDDNRHARNGAGVDEPVLIDRA